MEQLHSLRQRTNNATKQLFRGPVDDDEPEYLAEDEQAELIETLRTSNERANDQFKVRLNLHIFDILRGHIGFVIYNAWTKTSAHTPVMDKDLNQSISPIAGTFFALMSYVISIWIIQDTTRVNLKNVAGWTVVSTIPIALGLLGAVATFDLLWWSMPLILQVLDLASLWIMQDPTEAFLHLERSQYHLKGA
ncbi:hypothetical protein BG004_002925 [Podila humilis]|nr:hypothetical protein BG004_002925 [Podila humilis]